MLKLRSFRLCRGAEIVAKAQTWRCTGQPADGRPAWSTRHQASSLLESRCGRRSACTGSRNARARPVQVFSALTPTILTLAHAPNPKNYFFESDLVALAVGSIFEGDMATVMRALSHRDGQSIGQNREVAGAHFQRDTHAGKILAAKVFALLGGLDLSSRFQRGAQGVGRDNRLRFVRQMLDSTSPSLIRSRSVSLI